MGKVKKFFLKVLEVLGIFGAAFLAAFLFFRFGHKLKGIIGKVDGQIVGDKFREGENGEIVIKTMMGEKIVTLPEDVKYDQIEAVQYIPTGEVIVQINHTAKRRRP